MIWIDYKYIGIISPQLERFKHSGNVYTFRCPLCGDSKKKRTKARGGFFVREQQVFFHCFNCSTTLTFNKFIKKKFPEIFQEYIKEIYLESKGTPQKKVEISYDLPTKRSYDILKELPSIASLSENHPAQEYLRSRKISTKYFHRFFYAEHYNSWVNSIIPNKLPNWNCQDRIVIPFIDREMRLVGFTGRSLYDIEMNPAAQFNERYITIMIDETAPKIFGLELINFNDYVYILEGAFDSTFFPNAVAMNGADFRNIFDPSKSTVIYDNEPRNTQIRERLIKISKLGYGIFVWPRTYLGIPIHQYKDITDLVKAGVVSDVKKFVDEFTHRGNAALVRLCAI